MSEDISAGMRTAFFVVYDLDLLGKCKRCVGMEKLWQMHPSQKDGHGMHDII
jgi:hypothetical protein